MDNNNLDIEINFIDKDGNVITLETLFAIMENLMQYKEDFLDIIITLCHAENHSDLVAALLERYCEDFVFEIVLNALDFTEDFMQIHRDFGLLPLLYFDCPVDVDFDNYQNRVKEIMNKVDGRSRAVVFIPHSSEQLERLSDVYEMINNVSLVPCFMRLKFKEKFKISDKAKKNYQSFIDSIAAQYVLFSEGNVQYYNLLNNVRFRTLECPKNYIYRLRLSRNSNACIVYPNGELHDISMTEKFFPKLFEKEPKITFDEFDFKLKNFRLEEGKDRFLYQFVNGSRCEKCRLKEYCQGGVGNPLNVDDDFCDQMEFFSYGYFVLKDQGDVRALEKYPVRFPVKGTDAIGMAATVAQLGEKEGVMPPVKVVPGKQVRMKNNVNRVSENIDLNPILMTQNVVNTIMAPQVLSQIKSLGIDEKEVMKIVDFIKRLKIKVFPRDLGIYNGHLYIYNCTPEYRDFEQIDNLLFDAKSKKRRPNRGMKQSTTN